MLVSKDMEACDPKCSRVLKQVVRFSWGNFYFPCITCSIGREFSRATSSDTVHQILLNLALDSSAQPIWPHRSDVWYGACMWAGSGHRPSLCASLIWGIGPVVLPRDHVTWLHGLDPFYGL